VYVLTSDGVHDSVTPEEMAALARGAAGGLERACYQLVDLANERGGRDNSTVVMVRLIDGARADDPDDATAGV
jgi:protein phosphatase